MDNRYVVKVANVFSNYIEVIANNEQEAKEAAKEILNKEDIINSFKHYYEATIPPEHWGVMSKEDFDKLQQESPEEEKKDEQPA